PLEQGGELNDRAGESLELADHQAGRLPLGDPVERITEPRACEAFPTGRLDVPDDLEELPPAALTVPLDGEQLRLHLELRGAVAIRPEACVAKHAASGRGGRERGRRQRCG